MISKLSSWANVKNMLVTRGLVPQFVLIDSLYMIAAIDGAFALECVLPAFTDPTLKTDDQIDFETNFLSVANKKIGAIEVSKVPDPAPFATPSYRTKRNATPTIIDVAPGQSGVTDFILTAERYVQGGKLLVSNPQLGDYFTAEVYDPNGVIPAPYRAAMCEAWPSVAMYIEKEYMEPTGVHEINTYPLNARITPGLALRVTYFAVNSGVNRQLGINYYLTKKL